MQIVFIWIDRCEASNIWFCFCIIWFLIRPLIIFDFHWKIISFNIRIYWWLEYFIWYVNVFKINIFRCSYPIQYWNLMIIFYLHRLFNNLLIIIWALCVPYWCLVWYFCVFIHSSNHWYTILYIFLSLNFNIKICFNFLYY